MPAYRSHIIALSLYIASCISRYFHHNSYTASLLLRPSREAMPNISMIIFHTLHRKMPRLTTGHVSLTPTSFKLTKTVAKAVIIISNCYHMQNANTTDISYFHCIGR